MAMKPHTCIVCEKVLTPTIRVDDVFKVKKVHLKVYTCSLDCLITYNLSKTDSGDNE